LRGNSGLNPPVEAMPSEEEDLARRGGDGDPASESWPEELGEESPELSGPPSSVLPHSLPVFPRQNVNLITAPSNTGKTTLLLNMLSNRHLYFEPEGVKVLVYVNCNVRHNAVALENPFESLASSLEVLVLSLDQIEDVEGLLLHRVGYVVILDDVVAATPPVEHLITYATHHSDVTLFVVTQSLLSHKLFNLLYTRCTQ